MLSSFSLNCREQLASFDLFSLNFIFGVASVVVIWHSPFSTLMMHLCPIVIHETEFSYPKRRLTASELFVQAMRSLIGHCAHMLSRYGCDWL